MAKKSANPPFAPMAECGHESDYCKIFNEINEAVFVHDFKTGAILDVNEKMLKMYGYTKKEILKKNVGDLSSGKLPYAQKDAVKWIHATAKGKPQFFEWLAKDKSGRLFWVEVNLKVLEIKGTKTILAIVRDVTKQKEIEKNLKENETNTSVILDNINDIIFRISPFGIIQYVNPRVKDIYGYDPKELIGKRFKTTAPIYEWHKALQIIKQVLNGKIVKNFEIDQIAKDGSIITAEINTSPIIEDGKIVGILGVMRDTSERGKVEYARKVSELRYRRLFETAKDGILILDYKTGQIIDANPFIMDILDLPKEKFIGKKLWEMGAFKSIAENKANFLELKRKKYIRYEDLPMKASGGREIDVEFVSNVYNVDGQKVIQCNVRDITDRKLASDSLIKEREWSGNILQSVPNIIVGLGEKSKILLFNKFAEDFTGYKAKEVIEKSWIGTFIPKKLRKEIYGIWNKIVKHKLVEHHYTNSIITRKGEEKFISWNNTVLTENGKFKMVLSVGEDVTERKKTEEQLSISEREYRDIFNNATEGIFQSTLAGRYIKVNPAFAKIGGYNSPDEMINKVTNIQKQMYIHPEDRAKLVELLKKQDYVKNYEAEIRRKDGLPIWISMNIRSVKDDSGKMILLEGTVIDITESKKVRMALIKAEQEYRAIFESSNDAIMMLNQKGFFDCNKATLKIFGAKTVEEFCKFHPAQLSPPKQPDGTNSMKSANEKIAKAYKIGSNFFQWVHRRRNGEDFPADVLLSLMELDGKQVLQAIVRDVTERKKTEEAIKEAEEKYRTLYESSADAIMTLEPPSWRFTSGNPATIKMFAAKNEKVFTKYTPWKLSPKFQPDGAPSEKKAKTMIMKAMKEGSNFFEWTHKRVTGENFPATLLLTKMKRGKKIFLQATIRDIAEQKKAEESLRESEAKFRAVIEHITDVVFTTDLSGLVTFITPNVSEFGYIQKDIIGHPFINFIHTDDVKRIVAEFGATFKGGPHLRSEFRIKRKNGSYVVVEEMDDLIMEKGKPVRLVGTFRNITEQKNAQIELKKFQLGFERSGQIMFIADSEGKINYVNPTFEQIYGYKRAEVIGKTPRILKSGKQSSEFYKHFWNRLLNKEFFNDEIINKTKKGILINIRTSVNPILNDSNQIIGFLAIQTNITEQKKSEAELKKKIEQMEFIGRTNFKRHKEMLEMKREIERMKTEIEKLKA